MAKKKRSVKKKSKKKSVKKIPSKKIKVVKHVLRIVPLKKSFMITSILGFFISIFSIYRAYPSWGLAFAIVFAAMFIASLISMTYAPLEEKPREKEW